MHTHDRSAHAILDWLAAIGAGSAGELAAASCLSPPGRRGAASRGSRTRG